MRTPLFKVVVWAFLWSLSLIVAVCSVSILAGMRTDSLIGRLAACRAWAKQELPQVHSILENTHAIPVKEYALEIITEVGDVSSIPGVIREFGYDGRWWIRWYSQEERFVVDRWKKTVSDALIAFGGNAEEHLRAALTDSDEWVRYWALATLVQVEGFDDCELIRGLADSDSSNVVRAEARQALQRCTAH